MATLYEVHFTECADCDRPLNDYDDRITTDGRDELCAACALLRGFDLGHVED